MSTAEARIEVRGMTCNGCKNAVTGALTSLPGVKSAVVDLQGALALVEFDPAETGVAQLIEVISDLGYEAKAESVDAQ
jgi:copper chaperone